MDAPHPTPDPSRPAEASSGPYTLLGADGRTYSSAIPAALRSLYATYAQGNHCAAASALARWATNRRVTSSIAARSGKSSLVTS